MQISIANSFISLDIQKVIQTPKVSLGNWPSPLQHITSTPGFSIKRDDLSGYGRAGIKTRKLEGMLGHWKALGIKDVVGIVPNISNLRKDLELYAQNNSLGLHFLVTNEPNMSFEKRSKIKFENKTNYKLIGTSYLIVGLQMFKSYFSVLLKGSKTALFLPSISHPASVMGAATGLIEMYDQFQLMQMKPPRHIFVSACTGSSAAGLVLASAMLREAGYPPIKIHISKVFPGNLRLWIWYLIRWTKHKFQLEVKMQSLDYEIHESHSDVPYGKNNQSLIDICAEVQEKYQLHLDPIYGARAWSTMANYDTQGESFVFWHCGYTPDWNLFD